MYLLGDLLIRIKNGYRASRDSIEASYSKSNEEVLKKLEKLGFIKKYETKEEGGKKYFVIELLYKDKESALTEVKLFSKPGRRWYITVNELRPVQDGMGYAIISTSQGVLTHIEAKKKKVGGELLFHIW